MLGGDHRLRTGDPRTRRRQASAPTTLVSVGSCLIMLLSLNMEAMYRALDVSQSVVRLDPGGIASYAIAGIGFLGAGAIIKGKGTIRGLTTAAGLWLVTGVGLSVGANYIIPAVCTTLISVLLLYRCRRLRPFSRETSIRSSPSAPWSPLRRSGGSGNPLRIPTGFSIRF
ncbi:MAG: MgtC/SapB family protein [Desulfomicrobium escambiense]|nr:MgtC/SapB family protein [Desulfomicrobium escambiense]